MSIRVVAAEIEAKNATTRTAIPTAAQPRWPPFERVAETIATARRPFPSHRHAGVEVLTYVIEGQASYEFAADAPRPLEAGSTVLLTASQSVAHAIKPGKGHTVRWFAVVASLPPGSNALPRLQSARPEAAVGDSDDMRVRPLLGRGSTLESAVGLEAVEFQFRSNATTFRETGHERVAICYALAGRGTLGDVALEAGESALVEDAAGIAIQGQGGFQMVFVAAPRPK
jgi:quercetin 2,3-dioxygenase